MHHSACALQQRTPLYRVESKCKGQKSFSIRGPEKMLRDVVLLGILQTHCQALQEKESSWCCCFVVSHVRYSISSSEEYHLTVSLRCGFQIGSTTKKRDTVGMGQAHHCVICFWRSRGSLLCFRPACQCVARCACATFYCTSSSHVHLCQGRFVVRSAFIGEREEFCRNVGVKNLHCESHGLLPSNFR